jgi:hypothetical protein
MIDLLYAIGAGMAVAIAGALTWFLVWALVRAARNL